MADRFDHDETVGTPDEHHEILEAAAPEGRSDEADDGASADEESASPEGEDDADEAGASERRGVNSRDGARTVAELEDRLNETAEDDSAGEAEPSVSREVQLQAQVERLQAEADANRDKWMRSMAELENFRKRARRELDSSINLARADLLKQLLEVLDNFERALDAFDQAESPPDEVFLKGVTLIQDQLLKVLRDNGVSRIEAVGEPFDPNVHEAVSQIETDDVPSQHVAHVVKAGYRTDDMVLRPAVVVVAQ